MIKCINLKKVYRNGGNDFYALNNVSLNIKEKEICVIIGPSGSGKTTLLNVIGGIDQTDSGSIIVGGDHIENKTLDQLTEYRRNNIGFVFQFYNLIPDLTVYENVESVKDISTDNLDIDEVLDAVGMKSERNKFPNELSGGQQQRVAIARALVKNPKILLCDEPTGALDYKTSKDVLKLIERVNKKYGTTVVIITHNGAITQMAHRVIRLRSGEIAENTVNEEIVPAERIEW